ncbi:hypothetical protein AB205_0221460 [Aquarana catesbeiana]|uniref:Uncharacterized protein n=1 Tax=Aquarana catesbeiana TaxID=8400 RepID=A0A2G9RZ88_AQUCT|nr:hypothetical protein AB205_0221460 [Aquarana catesbeiana]
MAGATFAFLVEFFLHGVLLSKMLQIRKSLLRVSPIIIHHFLQVWMHRKGFGILRQPRRPKSQYPPICLLTISSSTPICMHSSVYSARPLSKWWDDSLLRRGDITPRPPMKRPEDQHTEEDAGSCWTDHLFQHLVLLERGSLIGLVDYPDDEEEEEEEDTSPRKRPRLGS